MLWDAWAGAGRVWPAAVGMGAAVPGGRRREPRQAFCGSWAAMLSPRLVYMEVACGIGFSFGWWCLVDSTWASRGKASKIVTHHA